MKYIAQCPDRLIKWLINGIWRSQVAKKEGLQNKSRRIYNTRVIILKPLPKPIWADPNGIYKDKRKVQKALAKHLEDFRHKSIADLNVDVICPDIIHRQFDRAGRISGKGFPEMWNFIDDTIKEIEARSRLIYFQKGLAHENRRHGGN